MTMSTETGVYGAKVQSWRKANPRAMLTRLLEEAPASAKKADLLRKFREEVLDDPDCLDVVIEYWFANNFYSLANPKELAAERTERRTKIREGVREKIKERITEQAKILLLDLMMPNGKPLNACTAKDCVSLGSKVGPWLTKIAKGLKPGQTVGSVFTEDQVREIYRHS